MQLQILTDTSSKVAATRSRLEKRAALSACLGQADADEVRLIVHYLSGSLPQGRIGLGPAILRELTDKDTAADPTLSLRDVDQTFDRIAATRGAGSQTARRELLGRLFSRATDPERAFLARLILGELRQGALEGLLIDAIASAASLPPSDVRRAVMLAGDAATVADAALREGAAGLERFRLQLLSPVQPMLASPAEDMSDALDSLGEAALEYKLDGARVQIHRLGDDVRIFSRRLHDVTASLPEIVAAVSELPVRQLVLDGEVIALRDNGRPLPFQVTMRRFGRRSDVAAMSTELPVSLFAFDCLHHDGEDLIDRPASTRFQSLADVLPETLRVPRQVTGNPQTAETFLRRALAGGHEGVMAKSLDSVYAAGSRGAEWLKVKQVHSLDLVVLAAEWGSGRRQGWLSNLHLGARDPETGGFVMLGKTFKGLTDKLLRWQTERLLELELGRDRHVVHVRPELVVEIAVNDIQASPQYPAGLALRFARVKRYREDKSADQADTIDTVRALYHEQTGQQ
ncbi:MAG: ATP-dependent DNA ligase [Gammaproteobacteria bacterium]|nr:ATP-dependent DNA ligase [Gammaproteobacteria bacterium]